MTDPDEGRLRRTFRRVVGGSTPDPHADDPVEVSGTGPIVALQQIRAVVDGLPMPDPFDVRALCAAVAEQRGREIKVLTYPPQVVDEARRMRTALPYGMWLPGNRADYIYYREDTSLTHQQHVILHELGHLCCRHGTDQFEDDEIEAFHEAGRVVDGGHQRTVYSGAQEWAAEMFAYLVEERLGPVRLGLDARPVEPAYGPIVERYRANLEH